VSGTIRFSEPALNTEHAFRDEGRFTAGSSSRPGSSSNDPSKVSARAVKTGRSPYGLTMTAGSVHPLSELLRRYSYAYTAAHDFEVCRQIMVEDYALIMGEHVVRGREEQYIPATARQFRQFPTLGFTVHDLVVGPDRAALHFSEHGYSTLHSCECSWSGISTYRWDGTRLTECRVEQDYFARRDQQRTLRANALLPAAIDPWHTYGEAPAPGVEETVRAWLVGGGLAGAAPGSLDDEHCCAPSRLLLDGSNVEVLDLFGAGRRAAFHVRTAGSYAGGLPGLDEHIGTAASLYCSGIATVADDGAVRVRAVTDRLAAERRLIDA